MIDFHSHFLPNVDDGAKNLPESLEMLRLSKASGVDTVVSTSHCYAFHGSKSITHFLEKRKTAYSLVCDAIKSEKDAYPKIVLGSEVHLVKNLSTFPELPLLCIENTDYILIEMPFGKWKDEDFEEIYRIKNLGLKPIIAHIDRYFEFSEKFSELFSLNLLYQANAESFISHSNRKKLLELFETDSLHILGSDMHNLSSRPPCFAEAYRIIEKKFGTPYSHYIDTASQRILENKTVPVPKLPRLNPIKKLIL
ncbi:MAG: hypothetical protein IK057_02580 [Clostridia bacterium]|nr:hypothetical protein [Clostridia bacterium]